MFWNKTVNSFKSYSQGNYLKNAPYNRLKLFIVHFLFFTFHLKESVKYSENALIGIKNYINCI